MSDAEIALIFWLVVGGALCLPMIIHWVKWVYYYVKIKRGGKF